LTYDDIGQPGLTAVGLGFVELGYQFNTNWAVVDPSIFTNGLVHAHSGAYAALDDSPNANGGNATITRVGGGTFSFLSTYLEGWNTPGVSVTFTGYLNNVVVGSVTGTAGGPDPGGPSPGATWSLVTTDFYNVDKVVITANGNAFLLDDTNVAAVAPSVATISATTDSGATDLNAGHVITISLSLNEPVYVTGSPFLLVNDNEVASYATGSGTQSLTFKYAVQPSDNIADLQVSGLNLNGGTIQDSSGIPLIGSVQGDLALQIDTTAPTPFMSDVVKNSNNSLTTLSGMSEAGSTVSVFDGTKPLGTVTADGSGNWRLQASISGGTHQFTETATDLAGNTGNSAGATVYAPGGNKTLTGGSGNDLLIGGNNDTLIGGAGNDTFVFNQGFGKETVADFNPSQDHLAFNHALFTQYTAAQVLSQTHDTSFGAVIVVDPHDTVTLTGVTVAQLQAAQTAHLNWLS
jgi:hypothetical protein